MSDELMTVFIEQLIANLEDIKSTLLIVLQHCQINIAENEIEKEINYDEKDTTNCAV